jgi:hypothetical protein
MTIKHFPAARLALLCGSLVLASCDSNATETHLFQLVEGDYTITAVDEVDNGCNLAMEKMTEMPLHLTLDNSTGKATLSDGTISACGPSLGQGYIRDNLGALSATPVRIPPMDLPTPGCSRLQSVTSTVTLTADGQFKVLVVHTETGRTSCVAPAGDSCTTRYTLSATRLGPI